MKERPILFNGEMVRAILEGRKTQTRRVVKPQPNEKGEDYLEAGDIIHDHMGYTPHGLLKLSRHKKNSGPDCRGWLISKDYLCPYGEPGDRLWVKEAWANYQMALCIRKLKSGRFYTEYSDGAAAYKADGFTSITDLREHLSLMCDIDQDDIFIEKNNWKPSIHMPRWASRITLEVVSVRVERVQEISASGVLKEAGSDKVPYSASSVFHISSFQKLWDFINEKRGFGWESNPWVWVVEFKVIK